MSLRKAQKKMLYQEGWLPSEINAFESARGGDIPSNHRVRQNFNFNSKPFRAARASRRRYIKDLKSQGWTDYEIKDKLVKFYKGKNRDSVLWGFIKIEYLPAKKVTDFVDALRRRSRASISKHFGRAYGRQIRREVRPKYLPKRPMYPSRPKLIRRVRRPS